MRLIGCDYDCMAKSVGRTVNWVVNGQMRELHTIGDLAQALGRSTHCVRQWEKMHLIPPAPLITQSGSISTRRRFYPVELIAALAQVAEREHFGRRRPSEGFLRHRAAFCNAWDDVMATLTAPACGVTDIAPSTNGSGEYDSRP